MNETAPKKVSWGQITAVAGTIFTLLVGGSAAIGVLSGWFDEAIDERVTEYIKEELKDPESFLSMKLERLVEEHAVELVQVVVDDDIDSLERRVGHLEDHHDPKQ